MSGQSDDHANFRRLSTSKIYEKILANQLYNYKESNESLDSLQFLFPAI